MQNKTFEVSVSERQEAPGCLGCLGVVVFGAQFIGYVIVLIAALGFMGYFV